MTEENRGTNPGIEELCTMEEKQEKRLSGTASGVADRISWGTEGSPNTPAGWWIRVVLCCKGSKGSVLSLFRVCWWLRAGISQLLWGPKVES
jgi:hypothetical protein